MKKTAKATVGQVYGYARVSLEKQDAERQVSEILAYCKAHGLGDAVIVQETIHGTVAEKPELERVIGKLGEGDTLAVWELSRLTRGGVAALFVLSERIRQAGAKLLEVKSGTVIDNTPAGSAYAFALGLAAQIERDMISARTKSALQARKAEGVKLGRPKGQSKLNERRGEIEKYLGLGINKTAIAKLMGCSRSALLNWLAVNGLGGKGVAKV